MKILIIMALLLVFAFVGFLAGMLCERERQDRLDKTGGLGRPPVNS